MRDQVASETVEGIDPAPTTARLQLVSSVYLGISMYTFHSIQSGVQQYQRLQADLEAYPTLDYPDDYVPNVPYIKDITNTMLAACMISFLVVIFWVIYSFLVLLGRFFSDLPLGYGSMLGACGCTAFVTLLAGIVLQGHNFLARGAKRYRIWTIATYQTYQATMVFAYILCGLYIFMCILMTVLAKWATKQEDRGKDYVAKTEMTTPPAASSAASGVASGGASAIPSNHGFGTNWPAPGAGSYRGGAV